MKTDSRWIGRALCALLLVAGCSNDSAMDSGAATDVPAPPAPLTPTAPLAPVASVTPATPAATPAAVAPADGAAEALPPATGVPGETGAAGATAAMDPSDTSGGMNQQPAGPEDGDPSAPIVAISGIACGGPSGGFGLGSPNHQIDGRDMIVTYPCNKHAGAPVTFVLNLHGTTPVAQHFYQHGYFSAHQYSESHNLIVVTPSSVVQQWGNGDNGEDEPHLMKLIEWVYADMGGEGKFDIREMWVGGHSWGGGYTARFGCKPELADKVRGLVLMSGGGVGGFGGAACADSVSLMISTAEGDGRMPSDQASVAAGHGCDTAQTETILENDHTFWPNCDPGFVHANYYMRGKEHATFMDAEVVLSIVDWIKIGRQ